MTSDHLPPVASCTRRNAPFPAPDPGPSPVIRKRFATAGFDRQAGRIHPSPYPMDATPSGSTAHPLGEKLSRHDSSRVAERHRARAERRKRRAKTLFAIIFLTGALGGSLYLISKGFSRMESSVDSAPP